MVYLQLMRAFSSATLKSIYFSCFSDLVFRKSELISRPCGHESIARNAFRKLLLCCSLKNTTAIITVKSGMHGARNLLASKQRCPGISGKICSEKDGENWLQCENCDGWTIAFAWVTQKKKLISWSGQIL